MVRRYRAVNGGVEEADQGGLVYHDDYAALESRAATLARENDALRKALEFYSNPDIWKAKPHPSGYSDCVPEVIADKGEIARAALNTTTASKEAPDA